MEGKWIYYRDRLLNSIITGTASSRLADFGLAAIFIAAALPKIADTDSFADAIASYRTVPTWLIAPAAYALPWFEALTGILIIIGQARTMCTAILLTMLLAYTVLTMAALVRGIDIHCGCFGGRGESAWHVILRNSIILCSFILVKCISHRLYLKNKNVKKGQTMNNKKISLLLLLCSCFAAEGRADAATTGPVHPDNLAPNKKFIRSYKKLKDWRAKTMTYHVNLPPDFHKDRRYPILFEWHGKGGGPGTNVFTSIYNVTGHVHVGLTYPLGCRHGTAMLYATPEYVEFFREVYKDVVENFNGNPEYLFLGGFSAGGFMVTGPGIAITIRAGLKPKLAGILAGGCSWICNPKYAGGVDIFLWYADNDRNSYNLPERITKLKKYARSLTVVLHKGAGHTCDNSFEGPAVRKFLAVQGPDAKDFKKLYKMQTCLHKGEWHLVIAPCCEILKKRNTAAVKAREILNHGVSRIETYLGRYQSPGMHWCYASELVKLQIRYHHLAFMRNFLRKKITHCKNSHAFSSILPPENNDSSSPEQPEKQTLTPESS